MVNCYICDKSIQHRDLGQLSREDFTKIIQKVLEGIDTDYVIVITEDDGLCGACQSLVARMSRLEAQLRTTSLGLRALLRLKYSLPPPVMEKIEYSKVQKTNSSISQTARLSKDNTTQTVIPYYEIQRHRVRNRQTQTVPIPVARKHKKTQTIEPFCEKRLKPSEQEIKIVSSVNEVECLETGDPLEVNIVRNSENTVQLAAREGLDSLSEVVSGSTERVALPNHNCHAEEREVVVESRKQTDNTVEVKQSVMRNPKTTKINLGLLKCARCCYKTKSPVLMKKHMLSFVNEEEFYCSICDYAFHKSIYFKRHKIRHSETSKNKHCIFCDAVVHDALHMRFHIEAVHKPNPFTHKCSICSRVFMFKPILRWHKKVKHNLINTFSCEKCDKSFSDRVKHNKHVEYYHRDSLNCKYCKKQISTVAQLISHENSKHRFDRAQHYQCRYCTKKFIQRERLPLHEKCHTGQFQHRCGECGCGFHDTESMEKHARNCKFFMKTVVSSSASSPKPQFQQLFLKQRLRNYKQLQFTHQSMLCDVCGKTLKTRQKFKIHREMHDSPHCFQCNLCKKKFRYKWNLAAHIKNFHMEADNAECTSSHASLT